MKDDICCGNCIHFQRLGEHLGNCRRYPPESLEIDDGAGYLLCWPKVHDDIYCGEFYDREDALEGVEVRKILKTKK